MARNLPAKSGTAPPASALERFFRNPRTGRWAVVQFPNLPLALFLVATAVRLAAHPRGGGGTVLSVVAGVSLAWWSVDEVVRGDSPFRRLLGAVVLIGSAAGLLLR